MTGDSARPAPHLLRIEKSVYGGDGLAHTPAGEVVFVPFALPGEVVQTRLAEEKRSGPEVREPSPDRVLPECVHFGVCGGCQYQMARYQAQLAIKGDILRETLERAEIPGLPAVRTWGSPDPYRYRNRIRLRVRSVNGALRLGYSVRGTNEFLPVRMCPIATPVLWDCAEVLMRSAAQDRDTAEWLGAATEVEVLCDAEAAKVGVHLLCAGAVPQRKGGLDRVVQRLLGAGIPVTSVGASRRHLPSGRALETLAASGADGLAYRVGQESFWLKRGSFFQVNRLLIPQIVELVCGERHGELAWDLYAGVGLFARGLARRFARVTAVEANPVAAEELRRGLRRPGDQAVRETTLAFLRKAAVQRDRPELIALDPPRAGAGEEACRLLLRLAPAEIVYVSCDPTTLARDLVVLAEAYCVAELHMVDLFPQTYHLETVIVLQRKPVAP